MLLINIAESYSSCQLFWIRKWKANSKFEFKSDIERYILLFFFILLQYFIRGLE